MKLNFDNLQSVKYSITNLPTESQDYWQSINNIKGDIFRNKGIDFEKIVLQSLHYFFINCVDTSRLNDSDWCLSFAKSLLDKNNTTGYTTLLSNPHSHNIEVRQCEFYKECFAFIQLAYYLNEINLEQNQYFIYFNHFITTGTKLPDDEYKLDLSYLHKQYKNYSKSSHDHKTTAAATIKHHFFGCLFLILNDLGLSTKNFKITSKEGRDYNPAVKVPREFRKYFPFILNQYDIKSAYPHFIDMTIGSSCAGSIYTNIQKYFNIERSEAKILFNKKLNSGKYHDRQHFINFFSPFYKEHTAALVDMIKSETKPLWSVMQHWEFIATDTFKKSNKIDYFTRLHDAMLIIDNCYLPEIRTDFHFYEFEHKALNSVDWDLGFRISNKKPRYYYVSAIPSNMKHTIKTENDSKGGARFKDKKNGFDIYQESFNYIKAGFNISYKGRSEGDAWIPFTENENIDKVINCSRVISKLNADLDTTSKYYIFEKIVANIHDFGVYSFNRDVLLDLMIDNCEGEPEIKSKNWYFKGNESYNNLNFYDFSKLLNESRAKAKFFFSGNSVFSIIEQSYREKKKMYIDLSRYGLTDRRECEVLFDMVDSFNVANGFESLKFAKNVNDLIGLYTNSGTLYRDALYMVTDLMYKQSENAISKGLNVHRATAKKLKKWFTTNQDFRAIQEIYFAMQDIIQNNESISYEIERSDTNRIIIKNVIEAPDKAPLPTMTPAQAFFIEHTDVSIEKNKEGIYEVNVTKTTDKAPDLTHSILNCSIDRAIQNNDEFILSWYLFQNKEMTEKHRKILKADLTRTADFVKELYKKKLPHHWSVETYYKHAS